jgi:thiol-disulfide isomerase/thioredoxin
MRLPSAPQTLFLFALAAFATADERLPQGSLTTILTETTFPEIVLGSPDADYWIQGPNGKPWFVMFYAPWCGHCKKVKPTFFKIGQEVRDTHNVGLVNW